MAQLKRKDAESEAVQEFDLNLERTTIGRAKDNVHVLTDNVASRHHAEICKTADGYVLNDLGSSNGTWVNGKRVDSHELVDGDAILVGKTTFTFSEPPWDGRTVLVDRSEMIPDDEPTHPPRSPGKPAQAPPAGPPTGARSPSPVPPPSPPPVQAPPPPPRTSPPATPVPARTPPPPAQAQRLPTGSAAVRTSAGGVSAGFGIRLGAYLLDALILGLITTVVLVPVGLLAAMLGQRSQGAVLAITGAGWLLVMIMSIAYIVIPWARSGATPGKKILSLKVIREDGIEPLGYGKAGLRFVGYMVSGMILYIGFIMAAFTENNKALHDMIAGTRVIRMPK